MRVIQWIHPFFITSCGEALGEELYSLMFDDHETDIAYGIAMLQCTTLVILKYIYTKDLFEFLMLLKCI